MSFSLLIHNVLLNGNSLGWVAVDSPYIKSTGFGPVPPEIIAQSKEIVDGNQAMLLPGVIDAHVHFREPGMTHKATIASESLAALTGGVTSVIEMPNTTPPTTSLDAWLDKMERAHASSSVNYAFMIGATSDNIDELKRADATKVPAVKVFMGSSTGNMLVNDDYFLRKIFSDQPLPVVVHAENQTLIDALTKKYAHEADISYHSVIRPVEACVRATELAMELAARYGKRLHIAHISTAAETRLLDASDTPAGKQITAEVSPHHLLFTKNDYKRLGAKIKINPSVKDISDRDELKKGVISGKLDIIATDHAPHLLSEKQGNLFTAVSGAPMIQFSLPVMLDMFDIDTVIARMSTSVADMFGIEKRGRLKEGYYADMVMVEKLEYPRIITDEEVVSKCGWTPLDGYSTNHRVVRTWVNGGSSPMALCFGAKHC